MSAVPISNLETDYIVLCITIEFAYVSHFVAYDNICECF